MANEFQLSYTGTTANLVGLLQNGNALYYNTGTTAFESYNASNIANYAAVVFSQTSYTSEYTGSMPTGITAGKYRLAVYSKASTNLATSDIVAASFVTSTSIEWKGSAELSSAADINVTVQSTSTSVTSLTSLVGTVSSEIGTISTSVAAVAAGTVSAMKADSFLANTFSRTLGKFSYNPTAGVMTIYLDDGVTVIGTVTITQTSGTITSRA